MALVADGFELTVTLADKGTNTGTLTYELTAEIVADAITESATIVAALAAVSDAVVSGYRVASKFMENAFVYPTVGEIEDKASCTGLIYGKGQKKCNFKIPAPKIGIFKAASGSGANEVDLVDGDFVTYRTIFQTGQLAYISDGEVLDSVVVGKRVHAKSNRG